MGWDSSAVALVKQLSTHYLIDTLGFETHMRQIRERRGEKIPGAWYVRPFFYTLFLEDEKILGTNDPVSIPPMVKEPDYEFEIAAFFTESIKTDNLRDAIEFVKTKMFFTIFCDFSARDHQKEDLMIPLSVSSSKGILPKSFGPEWVHGKKLDFDENGIPSMNMRLWVNGNLRCDSNFQTIYFTDPETGERKCWGFPHVIAWLGKRGQGFAQGHILGSGTIGNGSIAEHGPVRDKTGTITASARYPWLMDGDTLVLQADGIGTLTHTIKTYLAL